MSRFNESEPCSCGANPGQFHEPGCPYEECPFCRGQLFSCDCCYLVLNVDPSKDLTKKQAAAWDKALRQKGLIPHGKEVRAEGSWTPQERERAVLQICKEMEEASQQGASPKQIAIWSDRISGILQKGAGFLEINRAYYRSGGRMRLRPLPRP